MVNLTAEDFEKLKSMLQPKAETKNKTKQLWLQATKASSEIMDLYEGSFDKKELGRRPDKERLTMMIFTVILKASLAEQRDEMNRVSNSTMEK